MHGFLRTVSLPKVLRTDSTTTVFMLTSHKLAAYNYGQKVVHARAPAPRVTTHSCNVCVCCVGAVLVV